MLQCFPQVACCDRPKLANSATMVWLACTISGWWPQSWSHSQTTPWEPWEWKPGN